MKKSFLWAALLAAMLLAASCASTPPAQPAPAPTQPAPEQPKPEQPAVAAPDAELAQAKSLKQQIDSFSGLADYSADDYAAASNDLKAGEDTYGKDNAASKQSLDKAIAGFNTVLSKGAPQFVTKIQDQSTQSKKAADDLKAAVAVKDQYAEADAIYQRAQSEQASGDLANAAKDFADARDKFDAVTKVAQEKKTTAEKALQDAQTDMTASEQKAADAQKALQDEGITITGSGQ